MTAAITAITHLEGARAMTDDQSKDPGSDTLSTQRAIQRQQDQHDRQQQSAGGEEKSDNGGAVQAGAREQPVKLPAQHLDKPGREADLAGAALHGARLPRQRQAAGHGGADHRRRFGHRPRGRRAVRARRRRRGGGLPSSTEDAEETGAASRPRAGAACCCRAT
jgi:hypothetical protein